MRVTIIFGSDNGGTRSAAKVIAEHFPGSVQLDVVRATAADFEGADLLILGTPTYGLGDLQDDWDRARRILNATELSGRRVALFGLGDQVGYSDTFVDGLGSLFDLVIARGATVVGRTPTEGYDFEGSKAIRDGEFVGLVLDDDNQRDLTAGRIAAWTRTLVP